MSDAKEMKAHLVSVPMQDGAERATVVITQMMYAWCAIAHRIIAQVRFIALLLRLYLSYLWSTSKLIPQYPSTRGIWLMNSLWVSLYYIACDVLSKLRLISWIVKLLKAYDVSQNCAPF